MTDISLAQSVAQHVKPLSLMHPEFFSAGLKISEIVEHLEQHFEASYAQYSQSERIVHLTMTVMSKKVDDFLIALSILADLGSLEPALTISRTLFEFQIYQRVILESSIGIEARCLAYSILEQKQKLRGLKKRADVANNPQSQFYGNDSEITEKTRMREQRIKDFRSYATDSVALDTAETVLKADLFTLAKRVKLGDEYVLNYELQSSSSHGGADGLARYLTHDKKLHETQKERLLLKTLLSGSQSAFEVVGTAVGHMMTEDKNLAGTRTAIKNELEILSKSLKLKS